MASISFTDSTGSATINSSWPSGASRRFRNWVPDPEPHGEGAHRLSDGQFEQYVISERPMASFEMPGISNSQMAILDRFLSHANRGGTTFTVTTDDLASRTYTCCKAPGTKPHAVREDARPYEYTLYVTALNVATAPTAMLCVYQS